MPRLPSANDVEGRDPRPSYGVPDMPRNPVPAAIANFGQAVVGLGADIVQQQRAAAAEAERQQKLALSGTLLQMEAQWSGYVGSSEASSGADPGNPGGDGAENAGGGGGGGGAGLSAGGGGTAEPVYDMPDPFDESDPEDGTPVGQMVSPAGYSSKVLDEFDAAAKQTVASTPAKWKPYADAKLYRLRTRLANSAAKYQRRESERGYGIELRRNLGTILDQVYAHPEQWKERFQEGAAQYDLHPTASPGQKAVWKENWYNRAGQRLFEANPQFFIESERQRRAGALEAVPQQDGDVPIVVANQAGRVSKGSINGLNPELLTRFQATQNAYGQSVPIVSGFRDNRTNAKAGGVKGSQHLEGNAIDLDVSGLSIPERRKLIETASANGITGIGIYKNSLHFDIGKRRVWGPSTHADSVPSWAYSSTAKHMAGKAQPGRATRVAARPYPNTLEALWPRLIRQESGGDQGAISPVGATGIAQVMEDTGPEAAKLAGLPWDRNRWLKDPVYNEAIGKAYLADQWKKFDGDPAKALAAYNAGPGRTHAAIEKYGDDWLRHMPAETRGYVVAILGDNAPAVRGAGGRQVQVSTGTPGYGLVGDYVHQALAGVPFEQRLAMKEKFEKDQATARTAAAAERKGDLELGISTGIITNPNVILEDPLLDNHDKSILYEKYKSNQEDNSDVESVLSRLGMSGAPVGTGATPSVAVFDPMDGSPDRKALDKIYRKVVPQGALASGDPQATQMAFALWRKTGILPKAAEGEMLGMLRSEDNATVTTGLSYLAGLASERPDAFNSEVTNEQVKKSLVVYRSMRDAYSAEEIVERIRKSADPEQAKVREAVIETGKKDLDAITIADVTEAFDPGFFSAEPGAPEDVQMQQQLLTEYKTLVTEHFAETGNMSAAKKEALARLRYSWAPSVANNGRLMKFAPELYTQQVSGSHDWLKADLENTLKDLGYNAPIESAISPEPLGDGISDYALIPVPGRTRAAAAAKRPLPYHLVIEDEDGAPVIVMDKTGRPLELVFDYTKYATEAEIAREKDRALRPARDPDTMSMKDILELQNERRQGTLQ